MSGRAKLLGLSVVAAVALVLVLGGSVAATGSGYNQSYTQTPTNTITAVGLSAVSSSYSSGPNLTASFSVAGAINLANSDYGYWVYFGGTSSANASTIVEFSNNTTAGFWYAYSNSGSSLGSEAFVLSNGGATLTFQINVTSVGSSNAFAVDAYAWYVTNTAESYSWLGTDYQNLGGGGGGITCSGDSCTTNAAASSLFSGFLLYAILGIIVVVVIVVVVLVVVMRGRRPPAGAPPPMQGGWMPPLQPGMAPPPPQYQPMPPPPPP